tara:strand:- start:15589 stop:16488 length:900 start_codon:yes stop_codon:yes gene_type:complete
MPPMRRNASSVTSYKDQYKDLLMFDDNNQDAIATVYDALDLNIAQFISTDLNESGIRGITASAEQSGRIIIKISNPHTSVEYFHFSLFTQNNRYGGLHLTCPDNSLKGKKVYIANKEVLICCGKEDSKYIIINLIDTLTYYFSKRTRQSGLPLPPYVNEFISCCLDKSSNAEEDIINLLSQLKNKFKNYKPYDCSKNYNCHPPPRFHPFRRGGSTKLVIYLVKIEKIRELNKKLRKNKTKNKNNIEKNNKRIDELKKKIKKEKAKAKEKLKKEKAKTKEKDKLKKLKVKKVHITKKTKK